MKMILAALLLIASQAKAASPVFDVGYSTFVVVGVPLDTAPVGATLINSRPAGFSANVGFLRLVNPHPTWDIFVGDVNVSTDVYSANVGQIVKANGGTTDWPIAKDPLRNAAYTPIYARPANTATVETNRRPRLTVIWIGY